MRARHVLLGVVALAALGAAGAYGLGAWQGEPAAPRAIRTALGPQSLTFSSAYLRPGSRDGGAQERVELGAFFPDFTPAGSVSDVNAATKLDERFERTIFISIRAADASLDPTERVARLYARFLDPVAWTHPGGLVARAFQPGSPFEADELFFRGPEGRDFAARCPKPDQSRKTPSTCIAQFRQAGLDVEYRFSAMLLAEWEKLAAGVRGMVEAARR